MRTGRVRSVTMVLTHALKERPEGWCAGGDDGEVAFDGGDAGADREVYVWIGGAVGELDGEAVEAEDAHNADAVSGMKLVVSREREGMGGRMVCSLTPNLRRRQR